MIRKSFLPMILSSAALAGQSHAQDIPLVYGVEHSGSNCDQPVLPGFDELPNIRPLSDPFEWSDGSGRVTSFDQWRCRRAEIADEIEHYEVGEKPDRPANIDASYTDGVLTVAVTENGETLTLTSNVTLPDGSGPYPAVIGMGGAYGSIPADIFTSRGVAGIAFNFGQVMAHTQTRGREPINALYPDETYMGAYSAWPWGVSRLIDGLELVSDDLDIDLGHLAVTGCSFAGKMALFSGAFDERIALTIAQESGGGGAAAWRVSETLGNVETLGNTSFEWFIEDLRRYANYVYKLPHDHHELMALVAPRALLVLGNPDYEWLADESGYVSSAAALKVWEAFGIGDRFGYSIVAGHPHCGLPDVQRPEVEAFVDKFLLGDVAANTAVRIHPYDTVDAGRWTDWWGTDEPVFPDVVVDTTNVESLFLETECAMHGSDWEIVRADEASNGAYATIRAGLNSTNSPPAGSESTLRIPFTVSNDEAYYVFARVNGPTVDDDSVYLKIDDGEFIVANGLGTVGWQWVPMTSADLRAGDHMLTITYREDGLLLDKLNITSFAYGPMELGEQESSNSCSI
jgi:(4-O-methyl)-D-glucuronate---lignin esterase